MNGNAKYWIREIYRHIELALVNNTSNETRKCLNLVIEDTIDLEKILYGKSPIGEKLKNDLLESTND